MNDALEPARWLASRGWYVFPLEPGGKHPPRGLKWPEVATTDPAALEAMFNGEPRNIGIACGPSNLVVLDEDELGELERFAASAGATVPPTFAVATAKGRHLYFRRPAGAEIGNKARLNGFQVDVRGTGGYVVAPGSTHETGWRYEPVDPAAPVLELPDWLAELIQRPQRRPEPPRAAVAPPVASGSTEYGGKALEGELGRLAAASEGTRNDTLNQTYFAVRQLVDAGHVEGADAEARFLATARAIGLPEGEARRTMASAASAAAANPRADVPDPRAPSSSPARPAWLDLSGEAPAGNGAAPATEPERGRRVRLTPASTIKPKPVDWLWGGRIPVGQLTITPGRGGIGKSTFHGWLIAQLTTGKLPGVHFGTPKPCIIAATEDSWEHTIVPRLIAAGADLELVARADVITEAGNESALSLPADVGLLGDEIARAGVVLLSVDPLMSTVSGALDTHKDREVRTALDPLVTMAQRTGVAVLANAHFNKSSGKDPLALIMGAASFGNVPRAALGFARNDDAEDGSCVISQVKNNLGRMDLPSLAYQIETAYVDTDDGRAEVGRLVMLGESATSVAELLSHRGDDGERTKVDECADWLTDLLTERGGQAPRADVVKAARAEGFVGGTLDRAKAKAKITHKSGGYPRQTHWELPAPATPPQSGVTDAGVTGATALTSENAASAPQSHQHTETGVTEGDRCSCETPKVRQLSDGRWFCRDCGREAMTRDK